MLDVPRLRTTLCQVNKPDAVRKLVDLDVSETSGVDAPAHLRPGWIVMKSAKDRPVTDVLEHIRSTSKEGLVPTIEDLTKALAERDAQIEELLAKADTSESETEEDVLKALPEPVRKMFADQAEAIEKAQAQAEANEEALRKERDDRADEAAIAKAAGWEHLPLDPNEVGPALRKVAAIDAELAEAIEKALTGANATVESASIFDEIGKASRPVASDAYGQLEALAKAAVEDGKAENFAAAIADLATANPDLYARYQEEVA